MKWRNSMSHYDLILILDKGTKLPSEDEFANGCPKWVYSLTEPLMDKYSEHKGFEPYKTKCGCGDWKVNRWAAQAMDDAGLSKYTLHERVDFPNKEDKEINTIENVEAFDKAYEEYCKQLEEVKKGHPLYGKAEKDCYECNGTDIKISEFNPNGKWDYYIPFRSYESTSSIDTEYAGWLQVVTPDGVWHDGKKDNLSGARWKFTVKKILEQYADHPALHIDCHT